MKTVKINRNVIHKATILKKGATHKLPDDEAKRLIEGEHAEEVTGAPKERASEQDDSPRGILSRMKRPELLAEVERWNKENTDKQPIVVAANSSNAAIVEQLLTAAGYKPAQQ